MNTCENTGLNLDECYDYKEEAEGLFGMKVKK
jgi:hypothetical protein